MQLNPEQQELLGAYFDGEAGPSEIALAKALLERPEAQAYLADLQRVSQLVRTHAGATAPVNFSRSVQANLDGDFDSISRPTSNQRPVEFSPQASWRMPLMAAAAAVFVAAGVLFSGVLNYSAPTQTDSGASIGQGPKSRATSDDARTVLPPSAPAADTKRDDKGPEKTSPGANEPTPQPTQDDRVDKGSHSSGKTPGHGGGRGPDESPHDDDQKAASVQSISFDDAATEISVQFNRRASVTSVYTEILSISSLYGAANLRASRVNYGVASVGADFTQFHGVEVELDEERIPELLAALERLTHEQGMGAMVVPGHLRRSVAGQMRYVDALMDVAEALSKGETPDARELERTRARAEAYDAPALENYRKPLRADDTHWRRANGVLPEQVQREIVENLERAKGATNSRQAARAATSGSGHTVRVVIRLQ